MTAFIKNSLIDLKENLRDNNLSGILNPESDENLHAVDLSPARTGEPHSGLLIFTMISHLAFGPGDEDDDDDLDDDLLDDEEDDTLIPIQGDEEDDDLLSADEDDDIVPGTDMDDGDDLMDDDTADSDDDRSGVNRSTTGDMGSNVTGRNEGRTTGRMIDHEPGTSGI